MATVVFVLCAVTSLACAVLLLRAWRRTRVRLLLWSGACFVGLAVNNALVLADQTLPGVDLSVWRSVPALLGVLLLVWGLVREG